MLTIFQFILKKQILTDLKAEIKSNTVRVWSSDFQILMMDKSSRWKIHKQRVGLNNTTTKWT